MTAIRVLVADDHTILRSGLRMLIQSQGDMKLVGEAEDCGTVIAMARSLLPDVITLDLSMPGGTGLATIEKLRLVAPEARIVVLTMYEDTVYVRSALAAGASAYLVKSVADEALIGAIRSVYRGRVCIEVESPAALESWLDASPAMPASTLPMATLSAREREVLTLVAEGHTNRAIAERMALSVKTVESYRSRLMRKLGLSSRAEVTRLAMELGLLRNSAGNPVEDGQ